tara:strand:+ start:222 stop:701 length:480 start_codon:yes stop_codon:yes gene_type:complete
METSEINKLPNNYQQTNPGNDQNNKYYNEQTAHEHSELPNRDRVINPEKLTNDENVKVNFIPDSENDIYYIPTRQEMQKQEYNSPTQDIFSNITVEELRMPFFLMLLYIVFEFPIVRNFVKRTFIFAFDEHEQITFSGILIMGFLFSSSHFFLMKLINS